MKYYILLSNILSQNNILNLIFLVFSATFSNISAISWPPGLVEEEAEVPAGENHLPWASNW
jgi:hypothetical protein